MESFDLIYKMLWLDEGLHSRPYDDATGKRIKAPKGNVTIGIGHNLDALPLPLVIISKLLQIDAERAELSARKVLGFLHWESLSTNRRLALINLAFSVGESGLAGFVNMLEAIRKHAWLAAGEHLKRSKWFEQVDPNAAPGAGRDDRVYALLVYDRFDY
jgi:GH24 family phage-related lysozyme (muramidase)